MITRRCHRGTSLRYGFVLFLLGVTQSPILAAVPLPTGGQVDTVDFERHVMGLLTKAGCNMGSCHGSFQGRNGFRLSLFGYEPAMDYAALTRDNWGRRLNPQRPEDSLLLLKATGQIPHEGGVRFGKGSWMYQLFIEWIRQGARWTPGRGTVQRIDITPAPFALLESERGVQIRVTAHFIDGTQEDVTPFCDFRISDESVAQLSALGHLTPRQPGDAALTVLYRGQVQAIRVLVPAPRQAQPYPTIPEHNFIDREVFAKLRLLNIVPSELAPDAVFLRRVYIDTIGQLPTPEEVRAFLNDTDPNKREKLIDRLLTHPLHAALWATKLSDVTGNNTQALEIPVPLQPRRSQMWQDWLRKRIADNVPYDQIVRDILTATSRDGLSPQDWVAFAVKLDEQLAAGIQTDYPAKKTLDLFWRRQQPVPIEQWGEKVAAAFMGIRLECAQCHKHPTDRWTQEDYWAFANIFAGVTFQNNQFSHPEVKKLVDAINAERRAKAGQQNQAVILREMFVPDPIPANRLRPNPGTGRVPTPKALGGPVIPLQPGIDPRVRLAEWLTAPDNPYFARAMVNRVWAHYFGVGLVHPVDDFSQANPPTNPRLLDALAQEFIRSGFNLRHLEKLILMSRTYQLDSTVNETNKFDTNNYSRAYVRPLLAEQVVDILNCALGVTEPFAGPDAIFNGMRIVEVGSSRLNGNVAYVLRIFGRPPRTTACDCERASEPALPQTLFRMTDPSLLAKLNHPQGRVS
ncbi:MAG: DUF1549 and DUF1553 domain-containing protein, partial [Gemmataceae bacterium]|nr:DUF1549 and DUF1553 domain-containing protein [Gemmataceae bacterium]